MSKTHLKIVTLKSVPKDTAYFVDDETLKRWKEADELFRFTWWSPLFLYRWFRLKRTLDNEALRVVKNLQKPSAYPTPAKGSESKQLTPLTDLHEGEE